MPGPSDQVNSLLPPGNPANMDKIQNYFLIGPMGVGKTTIGRLLAGLLGVSFYDSDREIEASTGADISWIFDVEGEEGFRLRETKMIDILSSKKGIVLATGGGAVLSAQNRANLKNRGQVIYLKATVSQQFARTGRDRKNNSTVVSELQKRIGYRRVGETRPYRAVHG